VSQSPRCVRGLRKLRIDILRPRLWPAPAAVSRPAHNESATGRQLDLTTHHVPSRLLSDSCNPQAGNLHPPCTSFYFSALCSPFMISQTAKRWSGSLGVWGIGAGTALVFVRPFPQSLLQTVFSERKFLFFCQLLSVTPKVKNTLLLNIPVVCHLPFLEFDSSRVYAPSQVSSYYEDKTPASDKPF